MSPHGAHAGLLRDDLDFLHQDPSCRPGEAMRPSYVSLDLALDAVTDLLDRRSPDFCHTCMPEQDHFARARVAELVRSRDDAWESALGQLAPGSAALAFGHVWAAASLACEAGLALKAPVKARGRAEELLEAARARVLACAPGLTHSPELVLAVARASTLPSAVSPLDLADEAAAVALAAAPGTVVARARPLTSASAEPALLLAHCTWVHDGLLAGPPAVFELLSKRALARDSTATLGGADVVEALVCLARENPSTRLSELVPVAEAL
jgi:hypothetical protein